MTDDRYEAGMRVRREVLGDAHVDRATAAAAELDADFQRWITESAWGALWTRDDRSTGGPARASRSPCSPRCAPSDELALHIRAGRATA